MDIGDERGLDIGRASRDAEHGPFFGGQLANHASAQCFEDLFSGPIGDQFVGCLARPNQLQNHGRGVADFERVFPIHAQCDGEPGFGVFDIVDGSAEREAHELPRPDEVEFGAIHIPAARPIHDIAQEGDQCTVEGGSALRQRAGDLALLEE